MRGGAFILSFYSSGGSFLDPTTTRCGSAAVRCTVVHMDERANISSGMMLLGPRSSVVLSLSLPSLLFDLSILLYPFFISHRLISSRFAILYPLLTIILDTSFFSLSLILSAFFLLFVSLFSSSRRTCLLEGLELAGGHYGGYSVGFSRLAKAHERVCPPRVKELPREQVHLLPVSLYPFSFLSSASSSSLSFAFRLSSLRRALPTRPMPPPVRTLGFYLFSLITAVGM